MKATKEIKRSLKNYFETIQLKLWLQPKAEIKFSPFSFFRGDTDIVRKPLMEIVINIQRHKTLREAEETIIHELIHVTQALKGDYDQCTCRPEGFIKDCEICIKNELFAQANELHFWLTPKALKDFLWKTKENLKDVLIVT